MLLKCPHCNNVKDYTESEYKRIFITCKACAREFRAAECSPLTGREARDRVEILEMATVENPKVRIPPAPSEGETTRRPRGPLMDDAAPPRKGIFQRLFGRSE